MLAMVIGREQGPTFPRGLWFLERRKTALRGGSRERAADVAVIGYFAFIDSPTRELSPFRAKMGVRGVRRSNSRLTNCDRAITSRKRR